MVLPGATLLVHPANGWSIGPDDHEQVFGVKAQFLITIRHFDVSETLLVPAYLILHLRDEDAIVAEYPPGFLAGGSVQFEYGIVVGGRLLARGTDIAIFDPVIVLRGFVRCLVEPLGVGRIQDDAVEGRIRVGEVAAVNALCGVR